MRKSRIAAGLSQEQAAKQLGVDRTQWSYLEAGKQSIPAERIVDVCRIVQLSPTELLGAQPMAEAA